MNSDERLIKLIEGGLNTSSKYSMKLASTNVTTNLSDDNLAEVVTSKISLSESKRKYSKERKSSITKINRKSSLLSADYSSEEDSVFSDKDTSVIPIKEVLEENEADHHGVTYSQIDDSIYKYIFEDASDIDDCSLKRKSKSEAFANFNSKEETNINQKKTSSTSFGSHPILYNQARNTFDITFPKNLHSNNSLSYFVESAHNQMNRYNYGVYYYPRYHHNNEVRYSYQLKGGFNNQTLNHSYIQHQNNSNLNYNVGSIERGLVDPSKDLSNFTFEKKPNDCISISLTIKMIDDKIISKTDITRNDYTFFLKDRIINLISSKDSSKKMQKCIFLLNPEVINSILDEILPNIINSINNNFCNYFYQRFFKYLNTQQRLRVLNLFVENYFFSLCCLKTGVYLVIAIIEKVASTEEMDLINSALADKFLELLTNPNGYRVLEKITLRFEERYYIHIFSPIFSNFVNYSKNPYACEVLKVLLSKINKNNKLCKAFAQLISSSLLELSTDKTASSIVVAALYVSQLNLYYYT